MNLHDNTANKIINSGVYFCTRRVKANEKFSLSDFYFHKLQRNLENQSEQRYSRTLDPDCLRVTHFPTLALRTYDTRVYEIQASLLFWNPP